MWSYLGGEGAPNEMAPSPIPPYPGVGAVEERLTNYIHTCMYNIQQCRYIIRKPWQRGVYVQIYIHLLVRSLVVIFPKSPRDIIIIQT